MENKEHRLVEVEEEQLEQVAGGAARLRDLPQDGSMQNKGDDAQQVGQLKPTIWRFDA